MYTVTVHRSGKFEIYNQKRKKVVYDGSDRIIKDKAKSYESTSYAFINREDMLDSLAKWMSLAGYKKVTKILCP